MADKTSIEKILGPLFNTIFDNDSQSIVLDASHATHVEACFVKFCDGDTDDYVLAEAWAESMKHPIIKNIALKARHEVFNSMDSTPHKITQNIVLLRQSLSKRELLNISTKSDHQDTLLCDQQMRVQRYLEQIFPAQFHPILHKWTLELHNIIDSEDPTRSASNINNEDMPIKNTSSDNLDDLAMSDRMFIKLSTVWLKHTQGRGSAAFDEFDKTYRTFRLEGGVPSVPLNEDQH